MSDYLAKNREKKEREVKRRADQSAKASTFAAEQQQSSKLLQRLSDLTNANADLIRFGVQTVIPDTRVAKFSASSQKLRDAVALKLSAKRADEQKHLTEQLVKQARTIGVLDARNIIRILKKARGDSLVIDAVISELLKMCFAPQYSAAKNELALSLAGDLSRPHEGVETYRRQLSAEDRFSLKYGKPNSLVDIALMNTDSKSYRLFEFQSQMISAGMRLLTDPKAPNVLGCSPTTTGKTVAIIMLMAAIVKSTDVMCIYIAPSDLLALQTAASLRGVNDARLAVYTDLLTLAVDRPRVLVATPEQFLRLNDRTFSKANGRRVEILAFFDEFHHVEDRAYADALMVISKLTTNAIVLSATLGNLNNVSAFLETVFRRPVAQIQMPRRAVRLDYYYHNMRIHPWCGAQNRVRGLAPLDVLMAYRATYGRDPASLPSTPGEIDTLEDQLLGSADFKDFKMPPARKTTIQDVDAAIGKYVQDGTILVFCHDPEAVAKEFLQVQLKKLNTKYPWWNDMMAINQTYLDQVRKLQSRMIAVESSDDEDVKAEPQNALLDERARALCKILKGKELERQIAADPQLVQDIPADLMLCCNAAPKGAEVFNMNKTQAQCLQFGFSYLSQSDKLDNVFTSLRWLQMQNIGVLFVGPQMSVGLNLPIRTVVIYDPNSVFTANERAQMGGRAGRKGIDAFGSVVLLSDIVPVLNGSVDLKLPAVPRPASEIVKPAVTPKPVAINEPVRRPPTPDSWEDAADM